MKKQDDYSSRALCLETRIENYLKDWYETWDQSMETFPLTDIYFLQDNYIKKANEILMISDDAMDALLEAISFVRKDPFLSRLVWHFHNRIYKSPKRVDPEDIQFPRLIHDKSNINDFIGIIILISGFEKVVQEHRTMNISRKVTIDTFDDVRLWMEDFYKKQGRWGIGENHWLANHFMGRLFRLGRLQFEMTEFYGDISVFKNRNDGRILAISPGDTDFNKDSQNYYGDLISSNGRAMKESIELSRDEWELVLGKGQPVLDIHIPADGKMAHSLCGESMKMAKDFFPKHFPDKEFRAFNSTTWLLEPLFQELLPPHSNIVRFQHEFYIYPVLDDDFQVFERVFGEKPDDFTKAPRDTSIQRAVIDHYLAGGHLGFAGGFILMEDLDWGSRVYR